MVSDEEYEEYEALLVYDNKYEKYEDMPVIKNRKLSLFTPTLWYVNLPIEIPREDNLEDATPDNFLPTAIVVIEKEEHPAAKKNKQNFSNVTTKLATVLLIKYDSLPPWAY